jgi:hypothetical protein
MVERRRRERERERERRKLAGRLILLGAGASVVAGHSKAVAMLPVYYRM